MQAIATPIRRLVVAVAAALCLLSAASVAAPVSSASASTITFQTGYNYGGVFYRLPATNVFVFNSAGTRIASGTSNANGFISFALRQGQAVQLRFRKVSGTCPGAQYLYWLEVPRWTVPASSSHRVALNWQRSC